MIMMAVTHRGAAHAATFSFSATTSAATAVLVVVLVIVIVVVAILKRVKGDVYFKRVVRCAQPSSCNRLSNRESRRRCFPPSHFWRRRGTVKTMALMIC
jgi:hypothetical protein